MKTAPLVVVEHTLEERVDVVLDDYIVDLGRRFRALYGEEGAARHAQRMQDDLTRIRKRLGGERYQRVSAMMAEAFAEQAAGAGLAGHRQWIVTLLEQYYDPMYEYQLQQREGRELFRGPRAAVINWALDDG
jgi:tRNA 2-selenouridine synthase